MSLHYILDGYNLIHRIPHLSRGNLEESRLKLIQWIERQAPQGSRHNKVTIVFDGRADVFSWDRRESSVRVLFTSGESADDRIKAIVNEDGHPKTIVVISDDREIQSAVRQVGAQVMAVDAFAQKKKPSGQSKSRQKSKDDVLPTKSIPLRTQAQINQELEDLWLKDKD